MKPFGASDWTSPGHTAVLAVLLDRTIFGIVQIRFLRVVRSAVLPWLFKEQRKMSMEIAGSNLFEAIDFIDSGLQVA